LQVKSLLILSLFLVSKISPQELITDRPDQTESAVTVPFHSLQIETGFAYESFEENNLSVENYSIAGTLFRYGLDENVESRFGIGYLIHKAEETTVDFDDLLIGLKINFFREDTAPIDLGLLAHVIVPIFPLFSLQLVEPELIFAASRSLSDRFSLSANFGGTYNRQWSEIIYIYTGALGISLNDELNAFAELYGNFSAPFSPIHNFDGGFTYLFSSDLQLDISGGKGITGTDSFLFISSGISLRINSF